MDIILIAGLTFLFVPVFTALFPEEDFPFPNEKADWNRYEYKDTPEYKVTPKK